MHKKLTKLQMRAILVKNMKIEKRQGIKEIRERNHRKIMDAKAPRAEYQSKFRKDKREDTRGLDIKTDNMVKLILELSGVRGEALCPTRLAKYFGLKVEVMNQWINEANYELLSLARAGGMDIDTLAEQIDTEFLSEERDMVVKVFEEDYE